MVNVEKMTRDELRGEVRRLRTSIDFVMDRVNDVSNNNKVYALKVEELEQELVATHEAIRKYRKEVMNLDNNLALYVNFRRNLQSILSIPIIDK
jgi:chromosome segregation ATPase